MSSCIDVTILKQISTKPERLDTSVGTVTAGARIFVVSPCAAQATALLEDHEALAVVTPYQVDGCAHATDTTSNDDNGRLEVIFIACRYRWPRF